MQLATVEVARNLLGWKDANTTEINPKTAHPVIHLMEKQKAIESKGGTMRLGAYPCVLQNDTVASKLYGRERISERHRHRYEFNNRYKDALMKTGLVISGTSPDGELVEIVELRDHPWFLGCQFHPEFKSRPLEPHPLFASFVGAAHEHKLARAKADRYAAKRK
jgi:CTP synthase